MQRFDIFKDLQFDASKVAITPLGESDASKFIRIAMLDGQEMPSHQTKFPITVTILKGSIDFGVDGEVYLLESGNIVTLDANIAHDLKAHEDSVILLTLDKKDSVKRVEGLVFKQP